MVLTETFWPKGTIEMAPGMVSDNNKGNDAQNQNGTNHDGDPHDKDIERELLGLFFRCHIGFV